MTQHYTMLQRNLLYTGVTRGKRLVVLVGQKKAVAIAVRNVSGRRRWSKLQEWLRPGPPLSQPIGASTAPDIRQRPLDRAARPAGKPAPLRQACGAKRSSKQSTGDGNVRNIYACGEPGSGIP